MPLFKNNSLEDCLVTLQFRKKKKEKLFLKNPLKFQLLVKEQGRMPLE